MCSGKSSIKSETVSDTDNGYANVNAARPARYFECEFKTATRDHAVACTGKPLGKTSERVCKNRRKGALQMLNSLMATVIIVLLGIFAAGSVELAEERKERKRVQKHLRNKYGRTY